jgi:hypothetical protein
MSKHGAGETGMWLELPDPEDENVPLLFFVDPKDEESLTEFWYSLVETYGELGEDIMEEILGAKLLARAVCGALVQEGKLIRIDDEHYRLPDDPARPH